LLQKKKEETKTNAKQTNTETQDAKFLASEAKLRRQQQQQQQRWGEREFQTTTTTTTAVGSSSR
jgi:hypothetical protein